MRDEISSETTWIIFLASIREDRRNSIEIVTEDPLSLLENYTNETKGEGRKFEGK